MKLFKIILLSILFSGLNSSPVTRETPMDNEFPTGKQIRRRSTGDHGCQEKVVTICREEKKYYPTTDRLELFEQCMAYGFAYYCG